MIRKKLYITVKILQIWTPQIVTVTVACNCYKKGAVWFYDPVIRTKDIDGMANSVEPDQTAPLRSSLICIFTVCFHLSVLILRLFYDIRCVLLLRYN